jgi:hypothetical protein
MSLDQYTGAERNVIDLTQGPVIDLNRAAFYSADRAELEEAANRLLMSKAAQPAPTPGFAASAPVLWWPEDPKPSRRERAGGPQINVMTVLMVSIVATFAILLVGIIASAQY